jgi:monofunctional biosynthetic peptidoglycan transglycosylase
MSEDGQFCRHSGVDWGALNEVLEDADEDGPARGASTIAMQTTKNLFLWPSRSVLRKGMEIPLALALDFFWSKRRILEVYLNIAEWGPNGEFGAEAAARAAFGKSAGALTLRESALLATSLPNPLIRLPGRPRAGQVRLAERVAVRVGQSGPWLDCLRK